MTEHVMEPKKIVCAARFDGVDAPTRTIVAFEPFTVLRMDGTGGADDGQPSPTRQIRIPVTLGARR